MKDIGSYEASTTTTCQMTSSFYRVFTSSLLRGVWISYKGDLYNEDGSVIDAGIDIKGRSWGYPWYHISNPQKYPFIAMKSGDEINSFDTFYQQNHRLLEDADSTVLTEFFPTLEPVSTTGKGKKDAKPKKNKRDNQV